MAEISPTVSVATHTLIRRRNGGPMDPPFPRIMQVLQMNVALRCAAAREESISNDFRRLTPRDVVAWPEVRPVLRRYTRLRIAARVAADGTQRVQMLYVHVERVRGKDILECLPANRPCAVVCPTHYLGQLPPGRVASGAEVRTVGGPNAGFSCSSAGVAADDAP